MIRADSPSALILLVHCSCCLIFLRDVLFRKGRFEVCPFFYFFFGFEPPLLPPSLKGGSPQDGGGFGKVLDLKSHDTRFQPSNISNLRKVSEQWLENLAKVVLTEEGGQIAKHKDDPLWSPYEGDSWEVEETKKKTFSSQERSKEGIKKWRKMI
jgi:hypothetical protein